MKKYLILFFISTIFWENFICAQADENAVKINLSGFAIRNISVQYEKKLSEKISVAIAFRDLFYGKMPFTSTISKIVSNPYIPYDKLNVGTYGITPEARYYFSQAMKGFYVGVFGSYSHYKSDLPVVYGSKTGQFNGVVNTYTGGVQFGWQFRVFDRMFIDLWIVGPNYGASSGNLVFDGALSGNEQSALRFELEQIKTDVPFHFIDSYTVSGTGASMVVKGPWAGLRALGINLAYHF